MSNNKVTYVGVKVEWDKDSGILDIRDEYDRPLKLLYVMEEGIL